MKAVTTAAVMLGTLLAGTSAATAGVDAPTDYVSVGDSAAAGVQPPGFTALGYADQLALRMRMRSPLLRLVKLGCPGETTETLQALNAALVSTYRSEGALVADVAGPAYFNIADFATPVRTRWGVVPANVANACKWTWMCRRPPLGPDPDPNTRGYAVIADAFVALLGSA